MLNNKKILAIIPARGGSKRLPGKNIKSLQGKPLIAWTIEAALKSSYVDEVIVSTDDQAIADVSQSFGANVPFLRPVALSSDTASSNDVVLHVINTLEQKFDYVLLLQPTSPLRGWQDIDTAIELCVNNNAGGVVSVCECEHSPLWINTLPDDKNMAGFIRPVNQGQRSQDLPAYYRLNGAIYCYEAVALIENGGIYYNNQVFASTMSRESSIDIDHELDFKLAEVILNT
jgi:CMP-N-acetylneuraminic acid synthetase